MQKIKKTTSIAFAAPTGSKRRAYLPDDSILRGKTIVGVAAVRQQNGTNKVFSTNGNVILNDNAFLGCKITLFDQHETEFLNSLPLYFLALDPSHREFTPLDKCRGIQPSKSYIEFNGELSDIVDAEDIELHFLYE